MIAWKWFSELLNGCRTNPKFLQEFGEEARVGRCAIMSMPNQETGRCFVCHMLLESQTSFQIFLEIPGITAVEHYHEKHYIKILNKPLSDIYIIYQILRRKSFLSHNSFHCLNILPDSIIGIELQYRNSRNKQTIYLKY